MFDSELKTFLTVADSAGFTRAAELLNMSQSAVSAHIKRLEEKVGSALFQRTTRSVALTSKGKTLLGYARVIVSLQEEAKCRLCDQDKLRGHVRIGASEDFASANLPHILRMFGAHSPGITIEVMVDHTTKLLQQLDDDQLDLVLGKQCDAAQVDRGELLWMEPLIWAFAEHLHLPLEPVIPLAFFPEPCVFRSTALRVLAESDCRWRVALVSQSLSGVRAAAMAGFAATPISKSTLCSGLRAVPSKEGLPELPEVRVLMFTGRINGHRAKVVEKVAFVLKNWAISLQSGRPSTIGTEAA